MPDLDKSKWVFTRKVNMELLEWFVWINQYLKSTKNIKVLP